MIIGEHIGKVDDYNRQRDYGHPVFQVMYGSPQSLNGIEQCYYDDERTTPRWIWHASYIAAAKPKKEDGFDVKCGKYLLQMAYHAKQINVESVVLHTGAVKGLSPAYIMYEIKSFFKKFDLDRSLFAIELSSVYCTFNQDPSIIASEGFNWCLDLAHSHAAGCQWERLLTVIDKYPPLVCHCNYPGSQFGSGLDIHGWRHQPNLVKYKRNASPTVKDRALLAHQFDDTIRLLNAKGVPLIIEGSGFAPTDSEIDYMITLFGDNHGRNSQTLDPLGRTSGGET